MFIWVSVIAVKSEQRYRANGVNDTRKPKLKLIKSFSNISKPDFSISDLCPVLALFFVSPIQLYSTELAYFSIEAPFDASIYLP